MPAEGNGPRASIFERVRRGLRGTDRAEAPALPLGEALHPVTLAAIGVLVVNDWLLKPRHVALGIPAAITGKLSDLAGLACAPVLLSAVIGLALAIAARLGARVDPSLTRRRLLACTLATGVVFTLVKLVPAAAHLVAHALATVAGHAAIVADPTDLACLPAVLVALWVGRDELRRIPLGLPAAVHRLGRPALPALAGARWAGARADHLVTLGDAIDRWDVPAIDDSLANSSIYRSNPVRSF